MLGAHGCDGSSCHASIPCAIGRYLLSSLELSPNRRRMQQWVDCLLSVRVAAPVLFFYQFNA
jgi:hypothetical protein